MTEKEFKKLKIGDRITGTSIGVHEIANKEKYMGGLRYTLNPRSYASCSELWTKVSKTTKLSCETEESEESE